MNEYMEKAHSDGHKERNFVEELPMRSVQVPTSKDASSGSAWGAPSKLPVLVVDDERTVLRATSVLLRTSGIRNVLTLDDGRQLLRLLSETRVGVLILDLSMPHISGRELLERVAAEHPDIPVIVMTAVNELDRAVDCMRTGATDYLVKPVDNNRFIASVMRAVETRSLRDDMYSLKDYMLSDELKHPEAFAGIISENKVMRSLFQYVEAIASSDQPVLITGETGTGKQLFTGAIHRLSQCTGKMVTVNVAGFDDNVFSDSLFGHTKGAFTDAERMRDGFVAEATGGTLFLDEIGDLNESSQVKLLRLLQDCTYYPLGSDQQKKGHTRVVVATTRDIQEGTKAGTFRKDLYYCLRAHHMHVPPLRSRKEDLPALVNHFLEQAAVSLGKKAPKPPVELLDLLRTYHFPGNIRELEAMTHDAVAQHQGGILSLRSFRGAIGQEQSTMQRNNNPDHTASKIADLFGDRLPTLAESEEFLMSQALRLANGNQSIAAGMLGLTRQALNKRLVRRRNKSSTEGEE